MIFFGSPCDKAKKKKNVLPHFTQVTASADICSCLLAFLYLLECKFQPTPHYCREISWEDFSLKPRHSFKLSFFRCWSWCRDEFICSQCCCHAAHSWFPLPVSFFCFFVGFFFDSLCQKLHLSLTKSPAEWPGWSTVNGTCNRVELQMMHTGDCPSSSRQRKTVRWLDYCGGQTGLNYDE